jgi:NADPH-dependent 2,4-dienoyl-CoA reductase/sulfur reductase-like enzyme
MKVLIIGGGTSGTEVAWRLRQQDKEVEILILEKGLHLQYSPCSLPYLIGGEIKKADDVFLFDSGFYDFNHVKIELNAKVKKIDRKKKCVVYEKEGRENTADYDRLVIASGALLKIPPISGLDSVKYLF